jgi:TolB protein
MTKTYVRTTIAAAITAFTSVAWVVATMPAATATFPGHDGKIAFVRSNQIYTINPDGTGIRQLTSGAKNYRPKWSPNGQRIAYVHEATGGVKDLWVMSATGSAKAQVTHVGNVTEPTWSPDGKYLAFGGGTPTVLETIKSAAPFGQPTTSLAYFTNPGVTLCNSNGQPPASDPVSVDRFVAWSPDGDRIAVFNHSDCQLDDSIFMYYPATGEARQYAAVGGACCGVQDWVDLTWGPNGQFGYASTDHDEGEHPSTIVYPGYAGKPGDTGPAPDPAGIKIAVTNASTGTAKIYVQAVNGASRKLLATGYGADWQPTH